MKKINKLDVNLSDDVNDDFSTSRHIIVSLFGHRNIFSVKNNHNTFNATVVNDVYYVKEKNITIETNRNIQIRRKRRNKFV